MTIENATPRVIYAGNGSTTVFPITFHWDSSSEIAVVETDADGVETTLVLNTDYTLSGAGGDSGECTAVSAPASGVTWTIIRTTPLTQETNLQRGGNWDAETAEANFDKLTRIAQDHRARLDRMPELYKADTDGSGAFNARGNKLSNLADGTASTDAITKAQLEEIAGSAEDAADSAAAAATSATAAAASATAASTSATNASNSATAAAASASAAATSATDAQASAEKLQGTSASSIEIGTGSSIFTTQAGKLFEVGTYVTIRSDAAPTTNWMAGQVTAYSDTSLTVDVEQADGSGIHSDWSITVSGAPGATGPAGATGTAGDAGGDGWSPQFSVESDGERRVLKIVDWEGGTGTKPAVDKYVGTTGLVDLIADGIDIRGAAGAAGAGTGDMLAANNLSDVASASTSRTNLGVGTTDAPQFAGVNVGHATDTTITRVSAGVIAVEGQTVLTQDKIGTTLQSYDALLASIASLTFGAGNFIYGTGSDAATVGTITAFGRSLIDDVDAAAGRSTLGLGSLATVSAINNSNWSGTALALANGGTGATTAAGARTALELGTAAQSASTDFAAASHGHAIADVTNLQTTLDGKASTATSVSAGGIATGGGDLSANRTITVPECTAAEFRSATADKAIAPDVAWAAAAVVTLSYATTVSVDMSTGINFQLTLAGNPTLGNPTNAKVGQAGFIKIITAGTSRTMSYGSAWKASGGAQDISTSDTTDYLFYQVVDATTPIVVYSLVKDPT